MINVAEEKGEFLFAVSNIAYFYSYYENQCGVSLKNM